LNRFFGDFVHGRKTGADFILGQVCFCRVKDVHDLHANTSQYILTAQARGGGYELLAVQKSVSLEFAGTESCSFVGLWWISRVFGENGEAGE
jgi:hypothetical protein